MMTNVFLDSYVKDLFRKYKWLNFFNLSIERMRPLFEARRNYLEEVLDRAFLEYGTIENFLRIGCCVNLEILTRVKNLLQASSYCQ